jgi:choline kinase
VNAPCRAEGAGSGVGGLVLAAGAGTRLGPETAELPKTLLGVDGDRTILDVALGNFRHVGLDHAVVVTGHAHDRLAERVPALERRHGLSVELVYNPRALEWNNAYSLWCARDLFPEGVLLINGDTVHPPSVEETLLAARGPDILLALDDVKQLGEEEMKVRLDGDGRMAAINKALDPATAQGEYIGLTLIEPAAAPLLADALEATFRRDPQLYYEDGYQEFADRGGRVGAASIGAVDWAEVDDHADLARAREIACRC